MQPPWMVEAWREFGQKEIAGNQSNGRILAMFRDAGHPRTVHDETAWCAAFAGACLKRGGQAGTGSLMARSYLKWGRDAGRGRLGVIAVFTRGSDPAAGHVGFWIGENDSHILVLGGNQADSVSLMWIAKQRLLGLRWPAAATADATETAPGATRPPGQDSPFDMALAHVLAMEGGYTDDPHDPGGPTNLGITLATLAAHAGIELTAASAGALKQRLRSLDRKEAREIYLARYWRPAKAEHLPRPLALMHFDAAVNHGVGGAARMLQQALGVTVDGEIGPETRRAAWSGPVIRHIDAYADIRRQRYRSLGRFWRFGRGWLNRVDKTLTEASSMVSEADNPRSHKGETTMQNKQTDAGQAGEKWWGQSLTIWGSFITGLSTVLPVIAPFFGINLTSELVVTLGEDLVRLGQAIGGLVGTIMVIQGRMRATTRLTTREVTVKL